MYYLIVVSDVLVFIMLFIVIFRFIKKKSNVYLVWAIGFLFSALSMLSFLIYLRSDIILFFYIYYFLGAGIPPAMWGMGAIFVINRKRIRIISIYLTVFLSLLLLITLFLSSVSLTHSNLLISYFRSNHIFTKNISTSGSDVLKSGLWEIPVFGLTFLGTLEIIFSFVYSIYIVIKRKKFNRVAIGISIITIATIITGLIGTITRFEYFYLFWIGVVFGIFLIFIGLIIL